MLDGIIFGGMINMEEPTRPQDLSGISYTSIHRSAGSHRIASFLRQHGFDIEVVDFAPSWQFEEFQELIRSRMTPTMKFVGLGATFHMNTETLWRCFTWLKETYPDVLLVSGSTDFYNLHLIPVDYLVVGYGELAILKILEGTAKYTEEVIDKEGNKRRTVHALKEYPAYPMRNLSIDYEKRDFPQPFESVTMETSRGCRFKCAFCTWPILGVKDDHTRCSNDFRDNLMRNYDNYGIQRYSIADETFNDYSEKIIKYADVVESLPFKPNFVVDISEQTYCIPDLRILNILRACGLMGIFMELNHFIVRVLLLSVREWILIRLSKRFWILKITSLSIMVFIVELLD